MIERGKNRKKIAILSYYHFPCNHPVLENVFAKELANRYKVIWLLQGDVSRGNIAKWYNSDVLLSRKTSGNGWYSKILNQCLKWQKLIQLISLLRHNKIKIVLLRDLPFEALLIAPLRAIFKFKLFFQYSAPLGDMNLGNAKVNKNFKKFKYFIVGHLYNIAISKALKKADLIFPITEFHKKDLLAYQPENKIIPISMGVDESLFKNKDRKKVTFLENIKKKHYLIGYFGTLSFVRNPQFLLETFARVKDNLPNSKLILMGNAMNKWEEKKLKIICKEMNLNDNVIFTGKIARQKLMNYVSYCDVSLCAIPPIDYYKKSSPTKLYESLANEVPVVANKGIYEQEKVIFESGGGLIVDYDPKSFCSAIIKIIKDKKIKREMGKNGCKYIIANYSYKKIADRISPYFEDYFF